MASLFLAYTNYTKLKTKNNISAPADKNKMQNKKILTAVLTTLIVALGLFLRIYNIDNTPPGIYPDEAVNAEDAIRANNTGQYQWFYPANQGREGLFINIQALSLKIFGISVATLKLPAIIFGTLTILGTYLLAKELFGRRVGLFSSFLVAVSFWAINFSRIGFRANMLPFILVFAFYFLWRGLRTKKLSAFAMGGFIFGLGFHTYIAFRIAPLILAVVLVSLILSRENFLKNYWKHLLAFIVFVALAALPMIYTFFIAHPEYLESRSASISILSPEVNNGRPILTFLRSFSLSLIKYNFVGDMNWRHNYPPYPLLDPIAAIAFLFGFIYAAIKFFHLAYLRLFKKIRDTKLDIYTFLLIWFFAMLVPEFMTAEGNPHALRAIGTIPVVFIFAGLTFNYFLGQARKKTCLFQKISFFLVLLMLLSIGLFNSIKYHYFWANKPVVASSFNKNLTDIARYLQTLPVDQKTYVITSYNTLEKLPIFTLNSTRTATQYLYTNQIDQVQPGKDPFVIVMTARHEDAITPIKARYPNLEPVKINNSLGSIYYIFK